MLARATEIIRKGKASKSTEFGNMLKLQEAENQIITDCEVYPQRPYDSNLLVPAIDRYQAVPERVPGVCIPNRSTKSLERICEQKKRWFRNGQKWRMGCKGRVSVVKRRNGLSRCRYKGSVGMHRWLGFGAIPDTLINIGRAVELAATPQQAPGRHRFFDPPVTPAGFALPGGIDHNADNLNFVPESS